MRSVSAGEPIKLSASWYNRTLRNKTTSRKRQGGYSLGPFELWCASASAIGRFEPAAIDKVINPLTKDVLVNTSCNEYNWVVLQQAITGNMAVPCIVCGPTFANVQVISTDHKFVTYDDYSGGLISSNQGKAMILVGDAVGARTIFINIGNLGSLSIELVTCVLDADLSPSGALADFYTMEETFIESATLQDPLGAGVGLLAGDSSYALKTPTGYYFVQAPCSTSST